MTESASFLGVAKSSDSQRCIWPRAVQFPMRTSVESAKQQDSGAQVIVIEVPEWYRSMRGGCGVSGSRCGQAIDARNTTLLTRMA